MDCDVFFFFLTNYYSTETSSYLDQTFHDNMQAHFHPPDPSLAFMFARIVMARVPWYLPSFQAGIKETTASITGASLLVWLR